MRARHPSLAKALALLGLLAGSLGANAQPQLPPSAACLGLDAATPTQHLEHALRDPNYGTCFAGLAGEQKAACDALPAPAPNDPAAGARKRQCQQLAIVFQDLSVNFRWDAEYRGLVDECKRSSASLPCDGAAAIQKRMRCMVVMIVGGDTTECMGPVPQLPPFPPNR
jgi:hypothetical protein